jgi:prepilin-type N-terminal cleavage/methylation domain-containing protein
MNFRRSSQQPASARVEQGFTLIEVLICVVLMTMIMGAITGALISSLHQSSSTNQQVHESNDAQIIAGFLVRDAQSAGGTNPATGVADPGLGVAVPDVAGCAVPGTPVVGFHWIDFSPAGNTTHIANYSFVAAAQGQFQAQQLVRTTCVTGVNGGAAVSVTVGTRVLSAPVVTCLVAGNSVSPCPSIPDQITMQVTENNAPASATIPYSFTLTATVRSQAGAKPDSASPAPLVLLGRATCGGSENTTGLAVEPLFSVFGTTHVHVYGQAFINATDASGGACHAINLTNGGIYNADSTTSILQGGTCSASGGGSCPSGASLASYSPALIDPYATKPAPSGGANRNGCGGPGVYANTLTVSSGTCTLTPGTYILNNGVRVSGGATLQSSGGVLLYIKNGSFNANGAGAINLTGLSSGPYSGLVLWQDASDTNPLVFGGLGSSGSTSTFGGTIYAPAAEVSDSVTANTIVNARGLVAQTLVIQNTAALFGDAGMNIGVQPPTVSSTSPTSRDAGAVNQTITITGQTFENGATVAFSNPGITVNSTNFVNATTLNVNISIGTSATTGPVDVTVVNPDGGFGTGKNVFTVSPAPTLISTNPSSRGQGAQNQTITITGTGFLNGPTIAAAFSNPGITVNSTNFVNATTLTVNITIAKNAPTGPGNLTITNGDGSTATGNNVFTVNAAPTITAVNPNVRDQGATNQAILISGAGFVNGSNVSFSGAGVTGPTAFNSPTQLTVTVSVAANAALGARNVTVSNPDGGTATLNNGFTVSAGPTITNVQLKNKAGGIAGRMEQGDQIVVTFSTQMNVSSFCSTWSGTPALSGSDISVNVTDGGFFGTDKLGVSTSTSCAAFNFGTIDLRSNGYVSSNTTFGGAAGNTSIAWNGAAHTLTITLGAQSSGGVLTNNANTRPVYTASGLITDTTGGTLTNSPFTLANGIQF